MATTKHQTVFTPSTGSVDIYVWQDGDGASEWQVCFQYRNDMYGGYWQMWAEAKADGRQSDIERFGALSEALAVFKRRRYAFDLPAELVAEVR